MMTMTERMRETLQTLIGSMVGQSFESTDVDSWTSER